MDRFAIPHRRSPYLGHMKIDGTLQHSSPDELARVVSEFVDSIHASVNLLSRQLELRTPFLKHREKSVIRRAPAASRSSIPEGQAPFTSKLAGEHQPAERQPEVAGEHEPIVPDGQHSAPPDAQLERCFSGFSFMLEDDEGAHQSITFNAAWKNNENSMTSHSLHTNATKESEYKRSSAVNLESLTKVSSNCRLHEDNGRRRRFIIQPTSTFRVVWNIISLLFISYDIFWIPVQLAFVVQPHIITTVVDYAGLLFWTFDVLITFRTGYFDGPDLVMDPVHIAKAYAKSWLLMDILLVFGEIVVLYGEQFYSATLLRVTRSFRCLRCVRLVRIARVQWLLLKFEDYISTDLLMLVWVTVKMTLLLLFAVHLATCGWYTIGRNTRDGWTVTWYQAANITPAPEEDVLFWYFASARWMLAQLNGKTDDNVLRNMPEMAYTCVLAIIFPVVVISLFISKITQTLTEISAYAEEGARRRKLVCRFLQAHRIDGVLESLIKGSVAKALAHHNSAGEDVAVEAEVVELLPKHLQANLVFRIRVPLIQMHPLFGRLNRGQPRALRHVCLRGFQHIVATRSEEVFDHGDFCDSILFVSQGTFHYRHGVLDKTNAYMMDIHQIELGNVLLEGELLSRGIWLCEPALFTEWSNQGRLEACESSSLLSLESSDFQRVLSGYAVAHAMVSAYGTALVKEINGRQTLSDLMEVLSRP
eukprot:TRINITY_DN20842_c0_g1_i1.p1 TRINITY_DN20842_c0_g1~~TRINITY_DN20842_c0_g1_i1.p1  ORF type:complete len:703 (-),score=61.13 TRINITY_DN20842_c0_g1_i1:94-2202(-)